MATKVKGEAIKEGSIPLSALDDGLQKAIPALTGFIKKLNTKENANSTLKIPYCSEVVLYSNKNINILKNGESITYSDHGYELTIKGIQETSNFILEINGSQVDIFEIYLFKGINKIKKEFLSDELLNEIENAGSKADWNAQEGDISYIKNKTHYEYTQIVQSINDEYSIPIEVNSMFETDGNQRIELKKDLVINDEVFIFKDTLLCYLDDSDNIHNIQDCITYFNLGGAGTPETTIIQENNKWFIKHYNDDYSNDIIIRTELKCIDERYIPDTVVKTTPQTLTDSAKNQVLINLNIPENYVTKEQLSNYKKVYITEFTFYDIEEAIYNNNDYPISNKLKEAILNDKLVLIPIGNKGYIIPHIEIDDFIYLYFTKDTITYSLAIDANIVSYNEYTALLVDQCSIYDLNTNICLFYPVISIGMKNNYRIPDFNEIFYNIKISNLGYKIKNITKFYNLWSRLSLYTTTSNNISKLTTPEPNIVFSNGTAYINEYTYTDDGNCIWINVANKSICYTV